MRYAAKRNRLTGKPVGLLVARGGHAWVMTGFQATADPALTSNYRLTYIKTRAPVAHAEVSQPVSRLAARRLVLDEPCRCCTAATTTATAGRRGTAST